MDVRNKKVVVIGLGTSGRDACELLHDEGAIVSATDLDDTEVTHKNAEYLKERYLEYEIGSHSEGFLSDMDMMVLSPGVPRNSAPVKYAIEKNMPIIGEMELAASFCAGKIIAVTGTNGKSTVVSLLGDIFKACGRKTVVCGNIGNSFSGEIRNIDKDTIVILEVSSFQLEWIDTFKPHIACILNIEEDHLERYFSFSDYALAKMNIFKNQDNNDYAILNYDNEHLRSISDNIKPQKIFYSGSNNINGLYFSGNKIKYMILDKERDIVIVETDHLKGAHNRENILACVGIALLEKLDMDAVKKAILRFRPLPHRIEYLGTVSDITFVDDSKATNIDAAKRAIEMIDGKIILIAGGKDKGGDYTRISEVVKNKVRKMILIGEAAKNIKKALGSYTSIEEVKTLENAVSQAFKSANSGDTVLLSPMCSSFDMFRDYKHRGEVFVGAFEELKKQEKK